MLHNLWKYSNSYIDSACTGLTPKSTRIELDERSKVDLNERLTIIQEHQDEQIEVSITYFQMDEKKSGGSYVTTTGCVKKIDTYDHIVIMQDATKIPINDILEMECDILTKHINGGSF